MVPWWSRIARWPRADPARCLTAPSRLAAR
jgi:hypothetical protein